MSRTRRTCTVLLCTLAALVASAGAAAGAQAAPAVTDWTSVSANSASGTLLGTSVSLSGTHVWNTPTSRVDESWPYFSGPAFSPALPTTDRIDFPAGTRLTRLSGESGFTVTGTSVSGTPTNSLGTSSLNDASGTIKLTGTYTTITFTTTPNYTGPEDGIIVQLGSTPIG